MQDAHEMIHHVPDDLLEAIDYCYEQGWTDGLPVVPPEQNGGNVPARISLIQLPSRNEVRSKNLFNVSDVKMFWQSQGDYFAVKVDHHTKSKKSTYSGFELFRLREPMCPMEVLALPDKSEKIVAFAWEPNGHRFAIIHGLSLIPLCRCRRLRP